MPEAHSLVGKSSINGAGNAYEGGHDRGPRSLVQISDIADVPSRDYQRMPGVELSNIDECHGQFVRVHNARGPRPIGNIAECALAIHEVFLVRLGAKPGWAYGCRQMQAVGGSASVFSPGASVSAASSAQTSPRPVGSDGVRVSRTRPCPRCLGCCAKSSPGGDGIGHPFTAASNQAGLGPNAMQLQQCLALNGLDRTHAPAYSAPHDYRHTHRACAAPAGWNDPISVARKIKQAALHPKWPGRLPGCDRAHPKP